MFLIGYDALFDDDTHMKSSESVSGGSWFLIFIQYVFSILCYSLIV